MYTSTYARSLVSCHASVPVGKQISNEPYGATESDKVDNARTYDNGVSSTLFNANSSADITSLGSTGRTARKDPTKFAQALSGANATVTVTSGLHNLLRSACDCV